MPDPPRPPQPPAPPKTGLVCDSIYKEHRTPPGHPDSPERCDAILAALEKAKLLPKLERLRIRTATPKELMFVHHADYIETVKRDVASDDGWLSTGDTPLCERSFEVALYAVGGVLSAVDAVVEGRVRNAFCAVRPPGHHATPTRGKGFCIFNNVAIAARYAQKAHGLARVLIVDWDVHHGDGTQEAFYRDGSVMYFSTHQWPWYPGTGLREETGEGPGQGCIVNFPLPKGASAVGILAIYRDELAAAADRFRPDIVFVSAGFDSQLGDSLGMFRLDGDDFAEMTRIVAGIARKHAGGRLVSVLEGGYNLKLLGGSVAAHVRALMEGAADPS